MNVLFSFYLLLLHFLESTRYYRKLRILCWLKIDCIPECLIIREDFQCDFLEIRFFFVLIKLLHKVFALFVAEKFSLDGRLRYLFLVFDLFIALLRSLVMKGTWFPRTFFCFRGAYLLKMF